MTNLKLYEGKIYDIDLNAPPEVRWREFARAEGNTIHKLLNDTEEKLEELYAQRSVFLRPFLRAGSWGLSSLFHRAAQAIGQEYAAEISSLSRFAEVENWRVMAGNLLYDVTSMAEVYGCGCSSYSCVVDGAPVLARNMDWVIPESVGKYTRIIKFHRGDSMYLAVGVPGFVGIVSAMSKNWALAINQAPNIRKNNIFQWPALQCVRRVCDASFSYTALLDNFTRFVTAVPFFAHCVGTEPDEQTVVVGTGDEYRFRQPKNGSLIQTNHYLHEDLAHHNPVNTAGVEWDTYPRFRSLKRRLKTLPENEEDVLAKLRGRPVTHDGTVQQMMFCPATSGCVVKVKR